MSVFGKFGQRVIEARQREARRQVAGTLLNYDDATLKTLGYSREELKRSARGAHGSIFL